MGGNVNELRKEAAVREMATQVLSLAAEKLHILVQDIEAFEYSNRDCVVIDDLCYQIVGATRFLREPWPEKEN